MFLTGKPSHRNGIVLNGRAPKGSIYVRTTHAEKCNNDDTDVENERENERSDNTALKDVDIEITNKKAGKNDGIEADSTENPENKNHVEKDDYTKPDKYFCETLHLVNNDKLR